MPKSRLVSVLLSAKTVKRLRERTMKGQTFDQLINELLDGSTPERVSPEVIRGHNRRMKDGEWHSLREIRKSLGDEGRPFRARRSL